MAAVDSRSIRCDAIAMCGARRLHVAAAGTGGYWVAVGRSG